jgi:hypothetical protein
MELRHALGLCLLHLWAATTLLAAAAPAPAAAAPQEQGPPGLFVPAAPRGADARASRAWAVRSRHVDINPSAWGVPRRAGSAPRAILLNLFDDVSFAAVLDRAEDTLDGVTWAGHVPGRERSSVTLALVGGALAGSVIMPGAVYAIRYAGEGVHEIVEVDQSRFPPEAEPRRPPASAAVPDVPAAVDPAPAGDPLQDADPSPQIDVLALYTPAAAAAGGGSDAIVARITLGIGESNTSYANSNVAQRLRLVRAEQVDYTEHNDLGTDLDSLTNSDGSNPLSTPLGDTAALLRDIHGADLVVLVTAPPSPDYCGIAWVMETVGGAFEAYAFSVVTEDCVSPGGTLAHEFGHNMGAQHDWYMNNSTAPHTYAHGYVSTAARWRTVMAYDNLCTAQSFNCTRLLYWSNPDVTYGGAAMGIPGGTKSNCPTGNVSNVACDADDHRTLNETAATVAAFRTGPSRAASDFTPDLRSDILWRHAAQGDLWLWPMDGNTRQAESYVRTVADTTWEIRALGDQNGDGTADLLWRNRLSGQIYWWPMKAGRPQDEIYVATVDPAYDIVGTGDFDGDGKADILWRHTALGDVWVWLMDGAASKPGGQVYIDRVDPGYEVKGIRDLDGNGKADIVWHHAIRGEVWVWPMNGTTRLDQVWVGTVPDTEYQIQGVADVTGDGKADLVWWHATRGEVWVWTMNGTVRGAETWVATVPDTSYRIAATGDYDGGGRADLLWRNAANGEVWLWLMNGTARLSETWLATVPDAGYQIIKAR